MKNNFEIHTENEIIIFKNIFTIDSNSAIIYLKDSSKNIFNKNKENVYFYEVNEISNFLINKKSQSFDYLNKLENKIKLLSTWFNY